MKKERKTLPLAAIEANTGQLDWLPKNPRQWTKDDIQKTRASIEEDLDFLEDRPLLVVPHGEAFVVFAGNLRREGSLAAGCLNAPCVIYTPETPEDRETIKRRAIKDNGSFGSWDFDELANTWDDMPLADWGAPTWDFGSPKVNGNGDEDEKTHEDDFDEGKDEIHVRCKPGDVWQLGEHRLMCGDSIDLEQVKTLMGGGRS